jgi:type III restriction enzyme
MSLRKPQIQALEALAWLTEHISITKKGDSNEALQLIREKFSSVTDFERDFLNVCFALATGVGKTRLMGAFIAYLAQTKGVRNFFILAPNNTISEKLIREFSNISDPKYVFLGIPEFATNPPQIITEVNFEQGTGVRNRFACQADFFKGDEIHINIFNIAMIHSDKRRMKNPRETIVNCMSYFEYLSQLEDLVVLMDEAHRYRAQAASKAISELQPILGIELTATPHVETSNRSIPFKNVIYQYPLSEALNDGFVKEPWVGGRANFKASDYDEKTLEKLKIEDGVRIHESTKILLENYAYTSGKKPIKPFMLLIAQNMAHANEIESMIKSENFFSGRYRNRVRVVHSAVKADEEERMVKDLLEVESFDNPTEIVIHVNMLKEGWDVVNLYTIVPLRAFNSKTLIEQSLGRGLRLPYGRRTGVSEVDRLTIVSHDRFQEIINEAKHPESVIRSGFLIGEELPLEGLKSVDIKPVISQEIASLPETERQIAEKTIEQIEALGGRYKKEDLIEKVMSKSGETDSENNEKIKIIEKTAERYRELYFKIPRISVEPEVVKPGRYLEFSLTLENVCPQPIEHPIVMQNLHSSARENLSTENPFELNESPEHTIVSALLDFDDIAESENNIPLVMHLAQVQ